MSVDQEVGDPGDLSRIEEESISIDDYGLEVRSYYEDDIDNVMQSVAEHIYSSYASSPLSLKEKGKTLNYMNSLFNRELLVVDRMNSKTHDVIVDVETIAVIKSKISFIRKKFGWIDNRGKNIQGSTEDEKLDEFNAALELIVDVGTDLIQLYKSLVIIGMSKWMLRSLRDYFQKNLAILNWKDIYENETNNLATELYGYVFIRDTRPPSEQISNDETFAEGNPLRNQDVGSLGKKNDENLRVPDSSEIVRKSDLADIMTMITKLADLVNSQNVTLNSPPIIPNRNDNEQENLVNASKVTNFDMTNLGYTYGHVYQQFPKESELKSATVHDMVKFVDAVRNHTEKFQKMFFPGVYMVEDVKKTLSDKLVGLITADNELDKQNILTITNFSLHTGITSISDLQNYERCFSQRNIDQLIYIFKCYHFKFNTLEYTKKLKQFVKQTWDSAPYGTLFKYEALVSHISRWLSNLKKHIEYINLNSDAIPTIKNDNDLKNEGLLQSITSIFPENFQRYLHEKICSHTSSYMIKQTERNPYLVIKAIEEIIRHEIRQPGQKYQTVANVIETSFGSKPPKPKGKKINGVVLSDDDSSDGSTDEFALMTDKKQNTKDLPCIQSVAKIGGCSSYGDKCNFSHNETVLRQKAIEIKNTCDEWLNVHKPKSVYHVDENVTDDNGLIRFKQTVESHSDEDK